MWEYTSGVTPPPPLSNHRGPLSCLPCPVPCPHLSAPLPATCHCSTPTLYYHSLPFCNLLCCKEACRDSDYSLRRLASHLVKAPITYSGKREFESTVLTWPWNSDNSGTVFYIGDPYVIITHLKCSTLSGYSCLMQIGTSVADSLARRHRMQRSLPRLRRAYPLASHLVRATDSNSTRT